MTDIKNDQAVEEQLGLTNQTTAKKAYDYIVDDNRTDIDEINAVLKAEDSRRQGFKCAIYIGMGISACLYIVLLLIIVRLFCYSITLESFDQFNWKTLSILGLILGLPAVVILLSIAKLTSKPYRVTDKSHYQADQNYNISAIPAVEISKEGITLFKEMISIVKGIGK